MFQPSLRFCGLVYGPQEHHLDHIATLCATLDIPLMVTEEEIEKQAKLYYPQLVTFLLSYLVAANHLVQNYDIIITAMPVDMFDSLFFLAKKLSRKHPLTIWCPHGNSDKGYDSFFMSALNKEKILLVYGNKMLDFFKSKNALSPTAHVITVGNYRHEFYHKHKSFYQKKLHSQITSKLLPNRPTYLYAPTWEDHEKASSFHAAIPYLLESLPSEINLIVKFHPNTLLEETLKIKKLFWKYEHAPNVLFLEHFPLIYPLLDFVDIYIGDTSSIGYDFLTFKKPMFFLNVQEKIPERPLYQCGSLISQEEFPSVYTCIERHLKTDAAAFSKKREQMYAYTFSSSPTCDTMLSDLTSLCHQLRYEL
jgi:teichoic acid glycerol-phosphate primase